MYVLKEESVVFPHLSVRRTESIPYLVEIEVKGCSLALSLPTCTFRIGV